MRAILSGLAAAAMLSGAIEVQAHHSITHHPFKNASISWDPTDREIVPVQIKVKNDGTKYTEVTQEPISTRFRLQAKVKIGYRIYGIVGTTGEPDTHDSFPLAENEIGFSGGIYDRKINRHRTFTMPAVDALRGGSFGISELTPDEQAVKMCNDRFEGQPPGENTPIGQMTFQVHGGFSAGKRRPWLQFIDWGWRPDDTLSYPPAVAYAVVPVQIVCEGAHAGLAAAPKPENVDIRAKQVGEHCPARTEVTAYVDYLEKANPRIRAVRQGHVGRAVPFVEVETREVSFFGKTWHRAEHTFEYDLDPGKYNFRIEVEGGPNSNWAPIEIKCPPFEIVFTSLEYEVEEAESCPKLVEETIVFTTNGPGTIDYEIKIAGSQWFGRKGTVKAEREGDGYRAVVERAFPQEKEIDVFMTVEATKISGPNKPGGLANAFARFKVDCPPKVAVPAGSDKLSEPPRGEPSAPPATVIVVDPPRTPQLVCSMGHIVGSGSRATCVCPGGNKPRSFGPNQFACPVVDPVPQLVCTGGRVVGTGARASCVCPRGQERRDLGRNRFRCDAPVVRVTCQGGTVRGNDCVCARTLRKVQTGPSAWRCERPAAKAGSGPATVRPATKIQPAIKTQTQTRPVICQGGTVRRGECVCPRGQQKAPMAAANAWRCFDPRPARGTSVRTLPAQRSR